MAARKKKRAKRSRKGSARSGSHAAWKRAELKLARYFGVERTGLGRKGHDLSEAPTVKGWLNREAPELVDNEPEPFTHVCADSKCDKRILTTLERWHHHVLDCPDPYLIPLGIIGPPVALDDGLGPFLIGAVRLKELPFAYRALLAPQWGFQDCVLQVMHRFHIWRWPKDPVAFLLDSFDQVEAASAYWQGTRLEDTPTKPLSLVYGSYPKRISDAVFFKFPQY